MRGVTIRLGLPATTGSLPAVARRLGAPILISASCLWNKKAGRFQRRPGRAIDGLDVALDSAGYSAMVAWGGRHPWTIQQYVGLGASYPWAWWASMDFCVEEKVARDLETRYARIERTATMLQRCRELADQVREYGGECDDPLPVVQGWVPDDYEYSVGLTDTVLSGEWPDLVGVGSVCNRTSIQQVGEIVNRLHRLLPDHVGLHLFGVKGGALKKLRHHPRMVSTDSQAWGTAARQEARKTGASCTIAMKTEHIERWWFAQQAPEESQDQLGLFDGFREAS